MESKTRSNPILRCRGRVRFSTSNGLDASTCTPPTITTQPVGGARHSTSDPAVQLTAVFAGDIGASHTLSFQWYAGERGVTSQPLGTGTVSSTTTTLTVSPTTRT